MYGRYGSNALLYFSAQFFLAFPVFKLSIFCAVLICNAMDNLAYSSIPERKAPILCKVCGRPHWHAVLFTLFQLLQTSNTKNRIVQKIQLVP